MLTIIACSTSYVVLIVTAFLRLCVSDSASASGAEEQKRRHQNWRLLTSTFLHDISRSHDIPDWHCFLNFIFLTSISNNSDFEGRTVADFVLEWHLIREPYLVELSSKTVQSNRAKIQSKFRTSCWTNAFLCTEKYQASGNPTGSASSIQFLFPPAINDRLPLHNKSIYDQFIFISDDEETLKYLLLSSTGSNGLNILNSVTRKYGMYIDRHNDIAYFTEPSVYSGIFIKSPRVDFQAKISNLNGRTLTAVYAPFPPYIMNRKVGEKFEVAGPQSDLLHEISSLENVTFIFTDKLKTPGFGILLPNGSWTGMVAELVDGSADISLALGYTVNRQKYISCTTPSYLVSIIFSIRGASAKRKWEALVYPLTPLVWLITLATFAFFLAFVVAKVRLDHRDTGLSVFTLGIRLYTILLDQPAPLPRRNLSRWIVLLWIIFCYMIGQAYKANLVGFLTFTEQPVLPQTFKELLHHQPEYSIYLQTVGGLELELFRTSPSPIMKGIAKKMKLVDDIRSCLMKAATEETTACIGWKSAATTAMAMYSAENKELRSLYFATKDSGGMVHGSFGVRKNSIFEEVMIRYIGWARTADLYAHWYKMTTRRIERETREEHRRKGLKENDGGEGNGENHVGNEEKPLAKGDLFIVFFMTAVGIAVAIASFIGEIALRRGKLDFSGASFVS